MPKHKNKTDVIFRRFRSGSKEVIALFPGVFWSYGQISSYMRVGEHSGCNYWNLLSRTKIIKGKPLKDKDVKDVIKVLKNNFDYNLNVIYKMTNKHRRLLDQQTQETLNLYKNL